MIGNLQKYMTVFPPGPIPDTSDLAWLLANVWSELGGEGGEMDARLLFGRMQNVAWNPPLLTFTIEQYHSRYFGSTTVTIHDFTVDVAKGTVSGTEPRRRQRQFIPPRLEVSPIADEITFLIVNGKKDQRLEWYADGRVGVLVGDLLPVASPANKTLDARRKRLKLLILFLKKRLAEHGWRECGVHVYEKIKEQPE